MKKLLVLVLSFLVIVSCRKNNEVLTPESGSVIKAVMSVDAATKVSYTDGTVKLKQKWEVGDKLFGFFPQGQETKVAYTTPTVVAPTKLTYTVQSVDAQGVATLTSETSVPEGSKVFLFYNPKGSVSDIPDNVLTNGVTFDIKNQTYNDIPAVMTSVATMTGTGATFKFANTSAVLGVVDLNGLTVGKTINKISISGVNNKMHFAMSADTITNDTNSHDADIALTKTGNWTVDSDGKITDTVFFAVAPNAAASDITVTATATDGSTYDTTFVGKTIAAGKYLRLNEKSYLAVARIGTKDYATLSAAIDAVQAGDSLVILQNCSISAEGNGKNLQKNFVIDLNGKTVSAQASADKMVFVVYPSCTVKIKDTGTGGKIELKGGISIFGVLGKLIFESGELSCAGGTSSHNSLFSVQVISSSGYEGHFDVNGGVFSGGSGSGLFYFGIYAYDGTVNFNAAAEGRSTLAAMTIMGGARSPIVNVNLGGDTLKMDCPFVSQLVGELNMNSGCIEYAVDDDSPLRIGGGTCNIYGSSFNCSRPIQMQDDGVVNVDLKNTTQNFKGVSYVRLFGGTFNMKSGTINADNTEPTGLIFNYGGTCNITGGSITRTGAPVVQNQAGSFVMTDGYLCSNFSVVDMYGGSSYIKGGTVKKIEENSLFAVSAHRSQDPSVKMCGTVTISDSALIVAPQLALCAVDSVASCITVTGGYIEYKGNAPAEAEDGATISVSGGYFNRNDGLNNFVDAQHQIVTLGTPVEWKTHSFSYKVEEKE